MPSVHIIEAFVLKRKKIVGSLVSLAPRKPSVTEWCPYFRGSLTRGLDYSVSTSGYETGINWFVLVCLDTGRLMQESVALDTSHESSRGTTRLPSPELGADGDEFSDWDSWEGDNQVGSFKWKFSFV